MGSIPHPADVHTKASLFHQRLEDGPSWLAGLLRHKDPRTISEPERIYLRTKIIEYCDEAADTEAQQIVVDHTLKEILLQQFDDWQHSVTRIEYKAYLQTEGWDRTRLKVLERAKWTCEGCGEARATQVHHKTYDDPRGQEMLFNLVAVCADCHEKITAHEKARMT